MWNTELVALLRNVIGDVEIPYAYSDERLQQVILTAAQMVLCELTFTTDYVISVEELLLTPDPTDRVANTRDNSFINLIILKAGCFIDTAELKALADQSIEIQDGDSKIALGGRMQGRAKLWEKGLCSAYQTARDEYKAGNRYTAGAAILGPYRVGTLYGYSGRYR